MIKVLFFGDIFGRPGRGVVKDFVAEQKTKLKPDLIIVNADNIASGRGPTKKTYNEMLDAGVDVLTGGDHIFDQKEVFDIFEKRDCRLIRPANYPDLCPGKGLVELEVKGKKILILSLLGRIWTAEGLDSPFQKIDAILYEYKKTKLIIADFHAEATSEKNAFGVYCAGRVSACLGTHTHVQTADERILDKHTAYISDVGLCGPINSVIGVVKEQSIKRFRTGLPVTFDVAEGPVQVNAVLVEIDEKTGAAKKIERVNKIVSGD